MAYDRGLIGRMGNGHRSVSLGDRSVELPAAVWFRRALVVGDGGTGVGGAGGRGPLLGGVRDRRSSRSSGAYGKWSRFFRSVNRHVAESGAGHLNLLKLDLRGVRRVRTGPPPQTAR